MARTESVCVSSESVYFRVSLAKSVKGLVAAIILGAATLGWADYQPLGAQCDGLPKLPIGSMTGTCLGLLAGSDTGFIKPRKVVQVPGKTQLLVTDMGGWSDNRGVLWLLDFESDAGFRGPFSAHQLATGLSLPHDIEVGPDNRFYLGEADRIQRLSLNGRDLTEVETVVDGLPFVPDAYQHPLTNFVFLDNGDLLVNVGSKTDACGDHSGPCEEVASVGLRRYRYHEETNQWDPEYELYASGLRNSMALAVHDSGTVLQAENSSDLPSAAEPYEELNVIQQGAFYGWPYCLNRAFDQGKVPDGCQQPNYTEPYSLMPPHTAPLDMMYVDGSALPTLRNTLLVSWHGYRVMGHRLVSYEVDDQGLPVLTSAVTYSQDPLPPGTGFTRHAMQPSGGSSADAQHREVIHRWHEVPGVRPEGAPVGLLQLDDGSLVIVDDKNKALLRLAVGEAYLDEPQSNEPTPIDGFQWHGAAQTVLENRCSSCHTELTVDPGRLLNPGQWLRLSGDRTVLETRLTRQPRRMPPGEPLNAGELDTLLQAIQERSSPTGGN